MTREEASSNTQSQCHKINKNKNRKETNKIISGMLNDGIVNSFDKIQLMENLKSQRLGQVEKM